jgi:hypothetical protein
VQASEESARVYAKIIPARRFGGTKEETKSHWNLELSNSLTKKPEPFSRHQSTMLCANRLGLS